MPLFDLCRGLIRTWRTCEDVPYDVWGSVMGVLFPLCGELCIRGEVPHDWDYNPGCGYSDGKHSSEDEMYVEMYDLGTKPTDELVQFGEWLQAVRDGCIKNEKDY